MTTALGGRGVGDAGAVGVGRAGSRGGLAAGLLRDHGLLLVFLLILVVGSATSEYYLGVQNLQNLLRAMAVNGMLALGMTFVLLVGRIDLSVGALMIFSSVAGVHLMLLVGEVLDFRVLVRGNTYGASILPLMAFAVLAGAAIGLINGVGTTVGRITSFIMTLASLTALRGLTYVLTDGHPYYFKDDIYGWIGSATVLGVPFSFVFYLGATVIAGVVLRYTIVGRRIYAIGGDEKTARYAGINVDAWIVLAFVASGVSAALAGILFTARLGSVDAPLGVGYELTAIAIAVIGGTSLSGGRGSPYRTLLGGAVLAGALNLLNIWGVGTWYQNLVVGVVLILAVVVGRATRRGL